MNFKLCVGGKRIAIFAITQIVLGERYHYLTSQFTPTVSDKGCGWVLLDHLIAELEQLQALTLWLEVRKFNTLAIAMYRALGINEVSIRRYYYPSTNG